MGQGNAAVYRCLSLLPAKITQAILDSSRLLPVAGSNKAGIDSSSIPDGISSQLANSLSSWQTTMLSVSLRLNLHNHAFPLLLWLSETVPDQCTAFSGSHRPSILACPATILYSARLQSPFRISKSSADPPTMTTKSQANVAV